MKKLIPVRQNILNDNDQRAAKLRTLWDTNHTFVINIMASPGAGKTSFLEAIIPLLLPTNTVGVIEGDVVELDVNRLKKLHIPVVRANTHGACHLDAVMIEKVKDSLPRVDIIFIENVGNLICPANFPIGQHVNIVIASVPEGDDKPLKYPHMFEMVDAVVLNKIDLTTACDFSLNMFQTHVSEKHPHVPLFPISARKQEGLAEVKNWILKQMLMQ